MSFFHGRRSRFTAIAALGLACLAGGQLFATAPNVTYTATGTFASPPISGNDLFQLQGQPFSISVVANAATVPTSHGAHWAIYANLPMTGQVQSALLPSPIPIASNATHLELATGNPSNDIFVMECPINVVGLTMIIVATVNMPKGTIPSALIHPFTAPVTLTPSNATMTYSDGTNVTGLGLNGTLNATIPGMNLPVPGEAQLYPGAQEITIHAGGRQTLRPVGNTPVPVGASPETVALKFYACGISGASQVRMRIGAEDVPVLYAGNADPLPGIG